MNASVLVSSRCRAETADAMYCWASALATSAASDRIFVVVGDQHDAGVLFLGLHLHGGEKLRYRIERVPADHLESGSRPRDKLLHLHRDAVRGFGLAHGPAQQVFARRSLQLVAVGPERDQLHPLAFQLSRHLERGNLDLLAPPRESLESKPRFRQFAGVCKLARDLPEKRNHDRRGRNIESESLQDRLDHRTALHDLHFGGGRRRRGRRVILVLQRDAERVRLRRVDAHQHVRGIKRAGDIQVDDGKREHQAGNSGYLPGMVAHETEHAARRELPLVGRSRRWCIAETKQIHQSRPRSSTAFQYRGRLPHAQTIGRR